MPLEFDDHPFWDYSLRTYACEGVAAACLAFQDRFRIDVNILLFCSWIGHSGRGVMTGTELGAVRAAVSPRLCDGFCAAACRSTSLREY